MAGAGNGIDGIDGDDRDDHDADDAKPEDRYRNIKDHYLVSSYPESNPSAM